MNRFKQNALIRIHQERRDRKRRIKEEFADSGDAQKMIDAVNEKRKPSIDVDNLPF